MKKTWILIVMTTFWVCGSLGSSIAGPLEQIKNLKIDPKALKRLQPSAVEFQFSNFKLSQSSTNSPGAWAVDLTISQSIESNVYVVKSAVHDGTGNVLFSGNDIPLPAARAGKNYPLTRPLPARTGIATIVFSVFHRVENRIVASQTYPLSAIASYDIQGASTSSKPVAPQKAFDSNMAIDTNLDYAIFFKDKDDGTAQLTIKNNSSFSLKINELSQRADFSAGHDSFRSILSSCSAQEIPARGEVSCSYGTYRDCSAVKAIDFKVTLNGNTYYHGLKRDAPIRPIPHASISIAIKKETSFSTQYFYGPAIVEVRIRGHYLRQDERVTMKGIMSVDSHDFPVVFSGRQEEYAIIGNIAVEGKRVEAPEKACFRLMEITTNDDLNCGGVGILLYRNSFEGGGGGSRDFFRQIHCK